MEFWPGGVQLLLSGLAALPFCPLCSSYITRQLPLFNNRRCKINPGFFLIFFYRYKGASFKEESAGDGAAREVRVGARVDGECFGVGIGGLGGCWQVVRVKRKERSSSHRLVSSGACQPSSCLSVFPPPADFLLFFVLVCLAPVKQGTWFQIIFLLPILFFFNMASLDHLLRSSGELCWSLTCLSIVSNQPSGRNQHL